MRKIVKYIYLPLSLLICVPLFSQTIIDVREQFNCAWVGGAEVDLNNDGYLDLIYGGEQIWVRNYFNEDCEFLNNTNFTARVHLYNSQKQRYEDIHTNYFVGARPSLYFTDMNGDGIMDIVAGEFFKNQGDFYGGGIYLGNGDGNFTKQVMQFDLSSFVFRPSAVAVADFNNDGLPDIVCTGYDIVGGQNVSRAALLINKGNFKFRVTEQALLASPMMHFVQVKSFDCNNDGYMDFVIQGTCIPSTNNNSEFFADIYVNTGASNPGQFSRMNISSFVRPKANGGFNIADFDSDGWLDFFITGDAYYDGNNNLIGESAVCMNQRNGTFSVKPQPNLPVDFRTYNSTGNATRTIDWNNDGHYDLIVPGHQPVSSGGLGTQVAYYFINDGTGLFRQGIRIPGATECNILFPDWNGDGIVDYLIQGQSWDNTYFSETGKIAAVMINTAGQTNARPLPPGNLSVNTSGNHVTFSWEAEENKNLSYEYFIKDSQGNLYTACRSHIGGELDGKRKVLDLGNAMLNKSITLHNLPQGTYTWGVQTIDASYAGSVFTWGENFSVGETNIDNAELLPLSVYSKNNRLFISSLNDKIDVFVYAVSGMLINSEFNNSEHVFYLPNGVYLLKVIFKDGSIIYQKTIV
jgi:hypothetical protein